MSQSQVDPIQAALAAAQAAAAGMVNSAPAAPAGLPATAAPAGLPARPIPGKPIAMRDAMANRGVSVDAWLKVGFHGITIGKETDLIEGFTGWIDVPAAKFFYGVRYGGSNPIYNHTYDGIVAAKNNKPWADVMAEAYRVEANNQKFKGEYPGVELVVHPLEDVTNAKGDKVLARAGSKLGLSTSIMNFRDWESLYVKIQELGLEESKVLIDLGFEASNWNGKWGKFLFTDPRPFQPN